MNNKQRVSWFQRIVQQIARIEPVTKFFSRRIQKMDQFVMKVSKGKTTASRFLLGFPTIWVTTVGRKTGQRSTVPLVGIPDDDCYILIASNFGRKQLPNWYHNVINNPHVSVGRNGFEKKYVAQEVNGSDYDRMWLMAVDLYPGYEDYKTRAGDRKIPVIKLTALHDQ